MKAVANDGLRGLAGKWAERDYYVIQLCVAYGESRGLVDVGWCLQSGYIANHG